MTKKPIRALIFDYGNTLIRSASLTDSAIEAMGPSVGAQIGHHIDLQIQALYTRDQSQQPDWQAVWRKAFLESGVEYSEAATKAHLTVFNRQGTLFANTIQILNRFKTTGYRLGLLSNVTGPAELFDQDLHDKGIDNYFDAVAWSSRTGLRKPGPGAFKSLLQELNCAADETLMIGDSEIADIQGAINFGMKTLRVSNVTPCKTAADFQCTPETLDSTLQSILNRQGEPYV